MKNVTATLTVVLLALFLPWLAYSQEAKAPVYKDGDSWVFRYKAPDRLEEGKITFKNGKLVADSAGFWSSSIAVTLPHINPTFKPLDFPLTPGKKWS